MGTIVVEQKMSFPKCLSQESNPSCLINMRTSGLQIYGGLGSLPMISKHGPSLSKAVGSVDPIFLVVNKSHLNKNIHLTVSL